MPPIVVTFGEIMGRLNPPGFARLRQALPGPLEVSFAGSEANVAVAVACLGGRSRFVTALPDNPLTEACLGTLRGFGVDIDHVRLTRAGRLGLFFVEKGANQRPSRVVYDREGSAIALADPGLYDWPAAFEGAAWFHVSGITPAVSEGAATAAVNAVKAARAAGLTVSCDLNFRKKLWKWRPGTSERDLARAVMREVLPHVDLVIGNEEDADDVLGIAAAGSDVAAGRLEVERYPDVARAIVAAFPNVKRVATTLRESVSATHNDWGAMLFDTETDRAYFGPLTDGVYAPYPIRSIVDRVGGGDSFAGALIFVLMDKALSAPGEAVRFAAAASCLAHSIEGDFNLNSRAEVEALMKGSGSGRVVR